MSLMIRIVEHGEAASIVTANYGEPSQSLPSYWLIRSLASEGRTIRPHPSCISTSTSTP